MFNEWGGEGRGSPPVGMGGAPSKVLAPPKGCGVLGGMGG